MLISLCSFFMAFYLVMYDHFLAFFVYEIFWIPLNFIFTANIHSLFLFQCVIMQEINLYVFRVRVICGESTPWENELAQNLVINLDLQSQENF